MAIRNVNLKLGPISVAVGILGATESEDAGLVSVCTHSKGDKRPPATIKRRDYCPTCDNDDKSSFRKGRKSGTAIMLVDANALQALTPDEELKTSIDLTTHPAPQVVKACPSGKTYYLCPRPGEAAVYALLAAVLRGKPELAFIGEFSFQGPAMLYQVTLGDDGVLSMVQLTRPELVRARPVVDGTYNESYLAMALALADVKCVDFDAAAYADKRRAALAALLEDATPVALDDAKNPSAVTPASTDLGDALAAALQQAGVPAPVPAQRAVRAVRSAGGAKAPAKKAAAVPATKPAVKKAAAPRTRKSA